VSPATPSSRARTAPWSRSVQAGVVTPARPSLHPRLGDLRIATRHAFARHAPRRGVREAGEGRGRACDTGGPSYHRTRRGRHGVASRRHVLAPLRRRRSSCVRTPAGWPLVAAPPVCSPLLAYNAEPFSVCIRPSTFIVHVDLNALHCRWTYEQHRVRTRALCRSPGAAIASLTGSWAAPTPSSTACAGDGRPVPAAPW
jgi:hypothetical protein